MSIFSRNKVSGAQSFILSYLNRKCATVHSELEGPRGERRVNYSVVVMVVPCENGTVQADCAFATVTKEFSSTGVALVLSKPIGLDEVLLGFRWHGITWIRAKAKHLNPMGAGFYQLGFRLTERVHVGDYPELESIVF